MEKIKEWTWRHWVAWVMLRLCVGVTSFAIIYSCMHLELNEVNPMYIPLGTIGILGCMFSLVPFPIDFEIVKVEAWMKPIMDDLKYGRVRVKRKNK